MNDQRYGVWISTTAGLRDMWLLVPSLMHMWTGTKEDAKLEASDAMKRMNDPKRIRDGLTYEAKLLYP